MKAQVIKSPISNTFSPKITDNSESIKESYKFLTRPDGKPLSVQDKQLLDLVRQLTNKGTEFVDYPWLRDKLEKSNKTLNRVFANISLYFIGKFENKYIQEDIEYFNKITITETSECQNLLDNALIKLADSRYKKVDKTVHQGRQNCPPGETKLSTPIYIDRDNNRKTKEDRSEQSDLILNFSENSAEEETVPTDFTAKEELPMKDSEPAVNNVVPIRSKADKLLPSFFPLSMEITHEIAKQACRMEFSSDQIQDIANRISQKYPNKLIYRGKTDILIKYLTSVVKNERALSNPQQHYSADPGDAYLKYCQDLAEQIRIHGDSVLNYKH